MITTRTSIPVYDADGTLLASLDDDEVVVRRGRRVAARFRELEVELAGDAPATLLARLAQPLHTAGAQPVAQVPKLVHALGPAASAPWDLAPRDDDADAVGPTALTVARQRLLEHVGAGLVDGHAAVVLGEDPGALGRVRAAVSAILAELPAFSSGTDDDAVAALGDELRWLDEQLAAVGDPEQATGTAEAARERLLRVLRGRRYCATLVGAAALATGTLA